MLKGLFWILKSCRVGVWERRYWFFFLLLPALNKKRSQRSKKKKLKKKVRNTRSACVHYLNNLQFSHIIFKCFEVMIHDRETVLILFLYIYQRRRKENTYDLTWNWMKDVLSQLTKKSQASTLKYFSSTQWRFNMMYVGTEVIL